MKTLIRVVVIGGIALFSNRLFAQNISPCKVYL
jgi:hypothetical protein